MWTEEGTMVERKTLVRKEEGLREGAVGRMQNRE